MKQFTIGVARIEAIAPTRLREDIRLTFRFERGTAGFDLPLLFRSPEFDDTEIVKVARSRLSEVFLQLADQSAHWRLTEEELRALEGMNLRSGVRSA